MTFYYTTSPNSIIQNSIPYITIGTVAAADSSALLAHQLRLEELEKKSTEQSPVVSSLEQRLAELEKKVENEQSPVVSWWRCCCWWYTNETTQVEQAIEGDSIHGSGQQSTETST